MSTSTSSPRILLASASPERRRILERLGITFDVMPTGVAEDNDAALEPHELVARHASAKADAALDRTHDDPAGAVYDIVIACDTVVALDGAVLGSPRTDDEARRMLQTLCGKTHAILSGLVVAAPRQTQRALRIAETQVAIRELDDATIDAYVRTGEPLHKAGAYGIQGLGALLVERVAGSHTNVQGLPVEALAECLAELGYDLMALIEPGSLKANRSGHPESDRPASWGPAAHEPPHRES